MKFLADKTLGRLARWLKTLGYDTELYPGESGRSFLEAARKGGRIALSRKRDLAGRNFRGTLLVIRNDRIRDQIKELVNRLDLKPETGKVFTVCLVCNEPLESVPKDDIRDDVPEYVFETQESFRKCPKCGKIYWPATHREHALEFLRQLSNKKKSD
jgi:uncharacterized protein with PIN domain